MRPGAIVAGFILLGLGVAMLLDTTGMMHLHAGRLVAPFILIAIGSAIVLDRGGFVAEYRRPDEEDRVRIRHRRRGGPFGGLWLIGVGCWMLVSQAHLFGLTYGTSWPLFVILAGVMMMFRGMR
ncbi:MAG TPA: DUF5668 domain-containing protein [Vicinamibacterales bacterium]|nr:DUF5668 domain-containing protein [Vicinamibacterales bacterium]